MAKVIDEQLEQTTEDETVQSVDLADIESNLIVDDNDQRIEKILKESFIKEYLEITTITDITFNGTHLWIKDSIKGSYMAENQPTKEEAFDFGKAISNIRGGEFTYSDPILDTELSFYRVNMVHPIMSPSGTTFALRVSRPKFVTADLSSFANDDVAGLLSALVKGDTNVLISGITGTGKTELQKLLVNYIDERIVLIEDTMDSHIKHLYPEKDIVSWRTLTHHSRERKIGYHEGIQAGLRNDPKWLIVAETRGADAYNVVEAGVTGHNIITTIHAKSAELILSRLLSLMGEERNINEMRMGHDLVQTFPIGIQLVAEETDKGIERFIKSIVEFTDFDGKYTEYTYLYRLERAFNEEINQYDDKVITNKISDNLKKELEFNKLLHLVPKTFI